MSSFLIAAFVTCAGAQTPAAQPTAEPAVATQPVAPAPAPAPQPAPAASQPASPPATHPAPEPVGPATNQDHVTAPNSGEPPTDYGPFFAERAPSDTAFANGRSATKPPFLSVAGGRFCFLEDAACQVSLLASAHIAAGMHIPRGDIGVSLPYTQFGFRGGLTARPVTLLRKRWHPWSIGLIGGWVRGSGTVGNPTSLSPGGTDRQTAHVDMLRIGLINQLWLANKRNAFHLDFTLGPTRGPVTDVPGFYWGTHAEVAAAFGGWGAIFAAGDFLDGDTHITFGMRAHALPAAPVAALVILGLLAGGALTGGGA